MLDEPLGLTVHSLPAAAGSRGQRQPPHRGRALEDAGRAGGLRGAGGGLLFHLLRDPARRPGATSANWSSSEPLPAVTATSLDGASRAAAVAARPVAAGQRRRRRLRRRLRAASVPPAAAARRPGQGQGPRRLGLAGGGRQAGARGPAAGAGPGHRAARGRGPARAVAGAGARPGAGRSPVPGRPHGQLDDALSGRAGPGVRAQGQARPGAAAARLAQAGTCPDREAP